MPYDDFDVEFMSLDSSAFPSNTDNDIGAKKTRNKLVYEAKRKLLDGNCFCCNTSEFKICNSHSIPHSYLSNIAQEGKVYTINRILGIPLIDKESGLKTAGNFHMICSKCDSELFSSYENSDYSSTPSSKILSQIALKNYLKMIYKRSIDRNIYIESKKNLFDSELDTQIKTADMDLVWYKKCYNSIKKGIEKSKFTDFYLMYDAKLDYIVPLAFQNMVTVVTDFKGQIINNLFNDNPNVKLHDLHICIFPLKNKSVVMIFYDKKSNTYREFRKQFNSFNNNDKLAIVNYIIFKYSEDIFFSKHIGSQILQSQPLITATQSNLVAYSIIQDRRERMQKILKKAACEYDLNRFAQIPSLLSEKYKLNNVL